MQRPFYLEDPNDALFRNAGGLDTGLDDEEAALARLKKKKWLFRVRAFNLKPNETVCVIGSIPELGSWIPENCIPLTREPDTDIWSKVITIPSVFIEYRYCICVVIETGVHVIVRHWETHIPTRNIENSQVSPNIKQEPELYGHFVSCDKIERGWITKETIVQIKLFRNALTLWRPRYINRIAYIKVIPISIRHNTNVPKNIGEALEESLSADTHETMENAQHAITEVAVLNSEESKFNHQEQFGISTDADMIIFQCTVLHPQNTAFLIDLYVYSSRGTEEQPPYHAGFTYLLPSALQSSEGKCILPVTSTKHRPLGEIKVGYLVVRPIADIACNMKESYAKHWKKTRSGLEVGHRGSGSSYKIDTRNCAEVRENTLASFKTAINHGADYVEFDVQLTKDLVPVIYHDFHVYVAMRKKKDLEDSDLLECPLKDLTLEQLRLLKVCN